MTYKTYNVHCVGCGIFTSTIQHGEEFNHTCSCGSVIFFIEELGNKGLIPPVDFMLLMSGRLLQLPHIDQFLGSSLHVSPIKRQIIHELRKRECIWSHECENCHQEMIDKKIKELEMEESSKCE